MKKNRKKIIAIFSIAVMLFSMMPFQASAYVTNNETENNNTYATADVTYDDYNNYGTISSASDVDWWKITSTQTGMMQVWLGNIPSGCDYDIYLYKSDGESMLAYSVRSSGNQELLRARVRTGETFYLMVEGVKNYSTSSNYLLRFKLYDLKVGKIFTFNYADGSGGSPGVDTRPAASPVLNNLWSMGYSAGNHLNNTANPAFNVMPDSSIFIINGHGMAGAMIFYNYSYLFAEDQSWANSADAALSNYTSSQLSDLNLLVFCGCSTGINSASGFGNLVDKARSKGAKCVLGWEGTIHKDDAAAFLDYFTESLSGRPVNDALLNTKLWIEDIEIWDTIRSVYTGSSELESYSL